MNKKEIKALRELNDHVASIFDRSGMISNVDLQAFLDEIKEITADAEMHTVNYKLK